MRLLSLALLGAAVCAAQTYQPEIPKTWDDAMLADLATPVAGLNIRPGHFAEQEYYRAPVDNLRTYPVYYPGRGPAGYWEMLRSVGPQPLIEPAKLKSKADWVEAGRQVFEHYDVPTMRSSDARLVASMRSAAAHEEAHTRPLPDGTIFGNRWVVTGRGVELSVTNCAGCHLRTLPGGLRVAGPPENDPRTRLSIPLFHPGPSPFPLPGDPPGVARWRSYGTPWVQGDIHESIKSMPDQDFFFGLFIPAASNGVFARWNGSPYYTTKIPELIGMGDRKYIDHTATHQHRGAGNLMRYAALVTYSDSSDFGRHRMLADAQRKIPQRLPDEALYAMALYIYSLEPPTNPNRFDEKAALGKKIFEREGCAGCHTPPSYTNNKLTLA